MGRKRHSAEGIVNKMRQAGVDSIAPLLAAHENHHSEIQKAVDLWAARVTTLEQLQTAGGARSDEVAQAKASLASSRSELAETLEKEAELLARKAETAAQLDAATSRLAFLYEAAATLVGVAAADLRSPSTSDANTPPVKPRAFEVTWIEAGVYAAPRSAHAAIVASACSLHGPRSPVGGVVPTLFQISTPSAPAGLALRVGVAESTKRSVC